MNSEQLFIIKRAIDQEKIFWSTCLDNSDILLGSVAIQKRLESFNKKVKELNEASAALTKLWESQFT